MTQSDGTSARYLQPERIHSTGNSYSHVVEVLRGRPVYVSGQVSIDVNGEVVGRNDIRAQTHQAFVNVGEALSAVGAGFDDIVKLNYYITDSKFIPALREVRDAFIGEVNRPASTAVEVSRLFEDDLLVEIEAIALLDQNES